MRVIQILVDLTDTPRGLFHVDVQLPVRPDSTATFTTPLWIQESHRDNGPISSIAGLFFSAGERTLPWRRNPKAVSEYLVDIPAGVDTISATFDAIVTRFLTRRLTFLSWENALLYPAHRDVRKLAIQASITIPPTWGLSTSLENLGTPAVTHSADGGAKTFSYLPCSVERLEDSPALAGLYHSEHQVTSDGRHILCLAADTEEYTSPPQEVLGGLARLAEQTQAVFGARHYDRYRWLVALSEHIPQHGGGEHHDSTQIMMPLKGFADPKERGNYVQVLSHEYVHSWNGKYRRPAGHCPSDFATPLDGRLLWVYEGLSMYYQDVLCVRSGLRTPDGYREEVATIAAWVEGRAGKAWRSLEDTGAGSSLRVGTAWSNWMRGLDYYEEGLVLWLDVDTLIRSRSDNKRSLDDFAKPFFGREITTSPVVVPYTLGDVVSALNEVMPYDWQGFFQAKALDVAPQADLDGIERAGYRLVYCDQPEGTELREPERVTKSAIWHGLGIALGDEGVLADVRRYGPADRAGLAPRQKIAKVGDSEFSLENLVEEIRSKSGDGGGDPVRLTMVHEDDEWVVEIDYHGGMRFPRLVRQDGKPDLFQGILEKRDVAGMAEVL
ncbi:peptidase m61 domain protein [Echria macrotheca]|uniref:Peptidase m61 domain protein n=1 Tax=Echria macrotheca TaxID=438768 RepID=A0AAJ0BL83_9PEZI|nr:peptidase m61 domain protein [Echria macrotheca]